MTRSIWLAGIMVVAGATISMAQPPGGAGGPPGGRPPLIEALDADKDGTISSEELKNAMAALSSLDKNKDGKLSEDEYRPPMGRGPGGGQAGGQPGGPGGRPGAPQAGGPPGRGPQGAGNAGQMPPGPGQFVEHAMEFDADKDGKLDKAELAKMAESMAQHRGNAGGPGAGRPGAPEAGGRPRGEPGKAPAGGAADGQRPDRPKRPE